MFTFMACFALLAVVGAAGLTSFAPAAAFRTSTVPMMSSPMTRRRQTLEMQAIDTSTGQGAKLPQGPDRDGDEKPPEAAGPGGAAVLILLLLFTTNQWARPRTLRGRVVLNGCPKRRGELRSPLAG